MPEKLWIVAKRLEHRSPELSFEDAEPAARLLGAADNLRKTLGITVIGQFDPAGHVSRVRAALGEEAFAVAWAEGSAMPLNDAIDYACEREGLGPTRRPTRSSS